MKARRPFWILSLFLILIPLGFYLICYQPILVSDSKVYKGSPIPEIKPSTLEKNMRKILAFGERSWEKPEVLDRTADFIFSELQSYGLKPTRQKFQAERSTYQNILVRVGPEGPPQYVIGAHYDTCDGLPGADDNTSGTVGLLELARTLANFPPKSRIELAFYTLEEPPFFGTEKMGSYVHAASLASAGIKVHGMISVEMIGYFSEEKKSQEFPMPFLRFFYPDTGNFIIAVGNLKSRKLARLTRDRVNVVSKDLAAYSVNGPEWAPAFSFSDHWSFWRHGVPAVMLTDTAFLRNKNYHTADDLPEHLNFVKMSDVVGGLYKVAQAFMPEGF